MSANKRQSCQKPNKIKGIGSACLIMAFHLITIIGFAQNPNLGIPPTINYDKKSFNAGSQNRSMTYYKGRLYSANNGGLLAYDGINWSVHQTPENSILRSLATAPGDTIYVGGQGELGFFKPDEGGNLIYESLIDKLPEQYRDLGEIWEMTHIDKHLYVKIASDQILKLDNSGNHNSFIHQKDIGILTSVDNSVYYQVIGIGLFCIKDGTSTRIPHSESLKDYDIRSIHKADNDLLITTRNRGLYRLSENGISSWKTNIEDLLQSAVINNSITTPKGQLLIATQKRGILQLNKQGQAICLFNKDNGLQSNSAYSLVMSNSGELWASVGTGIDRINLNATSSKFHPAGELEGAVYDIEEWNGYLWFATDNGLFYLEQKDYYNPQTDTQFLAIPNTEGKVWGLNVINNNLFCGHEKGALLIDPQLNTRWQLEGLGTWMYISINPALIAVGTYEGVHLLENKKGRWIAKNKIPDLKESSRIMVKDANDDLWISHPYLKVYRVQFSDDYETTKLTEYDKDSGLNTNLRNYVFELEGNCYVSNETGVYKYRRNKDKFEISEAFKETYTSGNYLRSIIKKEEKTYAIAHSGTNQLNVTENGIALLPTATINTDDNYIGGFENLYAYGNNTILTCSDNGVVQFSCNHTPSPPQAPILLATLLRDSQDSTLYNGYGTSMPMELEGKRDAIRFSFSSLASTAYETAYYRYFLEGVDEEWSPWTAQPFKEYHQLEPGDYRFMVRAVGQDSSESPITDFTFSIAIPWSQSWWAVLAYTLGLLFIGLLLLLIPRKKYKENTNLLEAEKAEAEAQKIEIEKEKNRIEEEKRQADLEILEAQRKMELLEKEKLENEILFKNKELAMSTMTLLSKSETLDAIRTGMENIERKVFDSNTKKEIKKILSLLRSDDRLEDEWSNFSIHFDQAHHDFLKRLKEEYPKLTPKDQKLCAYLRMNLSTKEIAPLLKISVRGVEISRYRLRKKIELAKEVNLNEFMMGF